MHHVHVHLPSGEHACANHDDPIVPRMRRYLMATAVNHAEPRQADVDLIRQWYETNWAQSALCARHACNHW